MTHVYCRVRVLGAAADMTRFHHEAREAEAKHPSQLFTFTVLARNDQGEPLAIEYEAEQLGRFPAVAAYAMIDGHLDVVTHVRSRIDHQASREYVARRTVSLLYEPDQLQPKHEPVLTCDEYFLQWAKTLGIQVKLPEDTASAP